MGPLDRVLESGDKRHKFSLRFRLRGKQHFFPSQMSPNNLAKTTDCQSPSKELVLICSIPEKNEWTSATYLKGRISDAGIHVDTLAWLSLGFFQHNHPLCWGLSFFLCLLNSFLGFSCHFPQPYSHMPSFLTNTSLRYFLWGLELAWTVIWEVYGHSVCR